MKIALAQLNFITGNFEHNTSLILNAINRSGQAGADLVVFSELSVCGYPPRDFLEFDDFIQSCYESVNRIADSCLGIAAIVGAPSRNPGKKGKSLFNTAYFLSEGKAVGMAYKTLLPNYDVFDEYRYFESNRLPYRSIGFMGKKIALTICEDLWNVDDYPLYVRNPMERLSRQHPDLIINIAASPFHYNQPEARREILSRNARQYGVPVFYVNQVGGQTELLFDGGSMAINAGGCLAGELKRFEEDIRVFDSENLQTPEEGTGIQELGSDPAGNILHPAPDIRLIHSALVMGIRDYFSKMGFSRAILGLSGGIDSAVTLALAVEALGSEQIRALLLPSRFSSDHSLTDARRLAGNLHVAYDIISIEDAFKSVEGSLEPHFSGLQFDLAEENIQARLRAVVLMAIANKFGYILLNTSNKSEAAVGYGTLYGDMCGGISVIGDLYKTQVYELARYINRSEEVIPGNIMTKPPSAELRPHQQDSDSLPSYEILDKILSMYIEHRKGPRELTSMGFDSVLVKRILSMVNNSEWKRHQTPPILRISPKAFGMGRRMPIVGKYL